MQVKWRRLVLLAVNAFAWLTLATISCTRGGSLAATFTSPLGTYVVQVSGNFKPPSTPLVEHAIGFRALRGARIVGNGTLYAAGWNDPGFDEQFPKNDWPLENVLRFRVTGGESISLQDTLLISNVTHDSISVVRVRFADVYLILELDSKATLVLRSPRHSGASVSVDATLADGTRIKGTKSFQEADGKQPLTVRIDITARDVRLRLGDK